MRLVGSAEVEGAADEVVDRVLADLLVEIGDDARCRDGFGAAIDAGALVVRTADAPAPPGPATAGEEELGEIVHAVVDRTERSGRATLVGLGVRIEGAASVASVDGRTSRVQVEADVIGGTALVRVLLRLAGPFARAAMDPLVGIALDEIAQDAVRRGIVGLREGAPSVVELAPLEPEPAIPPVTRLGLGTAVVAACLLLPIVVTSWVISLTNGAATARVVTGAFVVALVAAFTLGPRLLRRRLEQARAKDAPTS